MMMIVDVRTTSAREVVRVAHTDTEVASAVIARAALARKTRGDMGVNMSRALDMGGEEVFEISTVTFWRD